MFYGLDPQNRPPLWLARERAMQAQHHHQHPAIPGNRPGGADGLFDLKLFANPITGPLLAPFAPILAALHHGGMPKDLMAKLFRCPQTGALKARDQFGNEAYIDEGDGYGADLGADYGAEAIGADYGALSRNQRRGAGLDATRPMQDRGEIYAINNAPPGAGRLTEIPMYQSGASTPRNALTIGGGGTATAVTVSSEDASYLDYRVVGFRAKVITSDNSMGTVEDFKAQGTPNLFPHESAADARQYDTSNDHLVGLRFQPVIRSPNRTSVSVGAIGNANAVVVVTCATVAEILSDDLFGVRKPGPYARSA